MQKTQIGCPVHGFFEQRVDAHATGSGCKKCGDLDQGLGRLKSHEKLIEDFKAIHGDRYDYSRVDYNGGRSKIIIGCRIHGWFEQLASNHMSGRNCKKCGDIEGGKTSKITLEEFLSRAKGWHGDKYDYSLVDLENNNISDKVKIICPIHGSFMQSATRHISGGRCQPCGKAYRADGAKLTQEEFISKVIAVHDNTYDYSKTVYTCAREKITITCKRHGDFEQSASAHSKGQGCPQCSQSNGEAAIALWLTSNDIDYVKEKTFKGCVSPKGGALKFDFYLPRHKVLIEFDGQHHYGPIEYFGGTKAFNLVQRHDTIKNDYAEKKGMPLLRIPFFSKKDVPVLLETFLTQITAATA